SDLSDVIMQRTEPVPSDLELVPADTTVTASSSKGLWRETLERLLRKPSAIVGLIILGVLVFVAITAPLLATHDPLAVLLDIPEEGVSKRMAPCIHLFGCPAAGDEIVQVTAEQPINVSALS